MIQRGLLLVEFNLSVPVWKYLTTSIPLRCFSHNLASSPSPSLKLISLSIWSLFIKSATKKRHQICAFCPPPSLNNVFFHFDFFIFLMHLQNICLVFWCSLITVTNLKFYPSLLFCYSSIVSLRNLSFYSTCLHNFLLIFKFLKNSWTRPFELLVWFLSFFMRNSLSCLLPYSTLHQSPVPLKSLSLLVCFYIYIYLIYIVLIPLHILFLSSESQILPY